uniref:AB hydrolase-1 domain-containing protein n=1 Tax=Chromera velia CCMP2878 TaxID=1169474 RepID=A0A0G4FB85_9ALVE|eukprot:Cvel_16107.t1-p1 / transcript=Cvel_16107.t1 / gene=Cvel_16107 / organism=Chromera_velia_CCMP2878 / gene_product=hypothetical protein / transcript_product=hypothetical protein / location=Cvel_scaffold1226:2062-5749(-) / protein_length=826 / sequence_SO=supercontig / SO=protein_coding / is_pseudo=false
MPSSGQTFRRLVAVSVVAGYGAVEAMHYQLFCERRKLLKKEMRKKVDPSFVFFMNDQAKKMSDEDVHHFLYYNFFGRDAISLHPDELRDWCAYYSSDDPESLPYNFPLFETWRERLQGLKTGKRFAQKFCPVGGGTSVVRNPADELGWRYGVAPVNVMYKPLLLSCILAAGRGVARTMMRQVGFVAYGPVGNPACPLTFWVYTPPRMRGGGKEGRVERKEDSPSPSTSSEASKESEVFPLENVPVLFLHGFGFGVLLYIANILWLVRSSVCSGRPVILPEMRWLGSMGTTGADEEGLEQLPSYPQLCIEIQRFVQKYMTEICPQADVLRIEREKALAAEREGDGENDRRDSQETMQTMGGSLDSPVPMMVDVLAHSYGTSVASALLLHCGENGVATVSAHRYESAAPVSKGGKGSLAPDEVDAFVPAFSLSRDKLTSAAAPFLSDAAWPLNVAASWFGLGGGSTGQEGETEDSTHTKKQEDQRASTPGVATERSGSPTGSQKETVGQEQKGSEVGMKKGGTAELLSPPSFTLSLPPSAVSTKAAASTPERQRGVEQNGKDIPKVQTEPSVVSEEKGQRRDTSEAPTPVVPEARRPVFYRRCALGDPICFFIQASKIAQLVHLPPWRIGFPDMRACRRAEAEKKAELVSEGEEEGKRGFWRLGPSWDQEGIHEDVSGGDEKLEEAERRAQEASKSFVSFAAGAALSKARDEISMYLDRAAIMKSLLVYWFFVFTDFGTVWTTSRQMHGHEYIDRGELMKLGNNLLVVLADTDLVVPGPAVYGYIQRFNAEAKEEEDKVRAIMARGGHGSCWTEQSANEIASFLNSRN